MAVLLCAAGCAPTAAPDGAEAELLRMHAALLEAHRSADVDLWLNMEAEDFVSANGGTITFPTIDERRNARTPYLERTTFSVYEDARPPIVRISDDGTLGWLIAEVRIRGESEAADGTRTPVAGDWAWIELYELRNGAWRMTGNVSNRRP